MELELSLKRRCEDSDGDRWVALKAEEVSLQRHTAASRYGVKYGLLRFINEDQKPVHLALGSMIFEDKGLW